MIAPPALAVARLTKRFGRIPAADGISLSLQAGDRFALIGPNGAGKSTFIDLVTGRLAPDAGTIHLGGHDATGLGEAARVRLGLARTFQVRPLMQGLTPGEHLGLAILGREGRLGRLFTRFDAQAATRREAQETLDRLGLGRQIDTPVETLAYGEQRLVEVALALVLRPRLLLLDEPSAGVPRGDARRLLEVLRALPASLTVLMIEHDMDMVFGFAGRVGVLAEGRLICEGTPQAVAADAEVRKVYLGRFNHEHRRA
jgi:branched-chain amino acid transport system ATP-binding protein